MRNLKIAAAVAGVIAAGSAFAWNPTVDSAPQVVSVVGGSSAFEKGFALEMKNDFCTSDYTTWTSSSSDFQAYSCTLGTGTLVPAALQGSTAVVYYRGEGGSAVGAFSVLYQQAVSHLAISSGCALTTGTVTPANYCCTVTNYCFVTDSADSGSALQKEVIELGISDVEPAMFNGENLFTIANSPFDTGTNGNDFSTGITVNQLALQGFTVQVNTAGTSTDVNTYFGSGTGSLSMASISGILSGNLVNWNKVPKADGSGYISSTSAPITVCRRDVGSGTQVAASVVFNDATCNAAGRAWKASSPINNSSTAMKTCLNGGNNAIGILGGFGAATNAKPVLINGVTPNLVNAATGSYPYAKIMVSMTNDAAVAAGVSPSASDVSLFTAILNATTKASALPVLGGQYAGISGVSGNVKAAAFSAAAPVAYVNNSKNSCKPFAN
jgi:hypothetical protein